MIIHKLEIAYLKDAEWLHQHIELSGNYVFGRRKDSCEKLGLILSEITTYIILPEAPSKLSRYHAIICEQKDIYEKKSFIILDGWGEYKSRNGIYLNSMLNRVVATPLETGSIILLGCEDIYLKYTTEMDISGNENNTTSS
jgi:hypothetical protein